MQQTQSMALFWTLVWCNYSAHSGALSFEKIFSVEKIQKDVYLRDASKQL